MCLCVLLSGWNIEGNSFFGKSVVSEGFEGLKSSFHLGKVSKAKMAWVR